MFESGCQKILSEIMVGFKWDVAGTVAPGGLYKTEI
jgi:hypothetical protein